MTNKELEKAQLCLQISKNAKLIEQNNNLKRRNRQIEKNLLEVQKLLNKNLEIK